MGEEMHEHSCIFAKQSKIMKLKNLKETTLKELIKQDINHQNIFPVGQNIFFPSELPSKVEVLQYNNKTSEIISTSKERESTSAST